MIDSDVTWRGQVLERLAQIEQQLGQVVVRQAQLELRYQGAAEVLGKLLETMRTIAGQPLRAPDQGEEFSRRCEEFSRR